MRTFFNASDARDARGASDCFSFASIAPFASLALNPLARRWRLFALGVVCVFLFACQPVEPAHPCPADTRLPFFSLPYEHWRLDQPIHDPMRF
jgi:hypothetical protein